MQCQLPHKNNGRLNLRNCWNESQKGTRENKVFVPCFYISINIILLNNISKIQRQTKRSAEAGLESTNDTHCLFSENIIVFLALQSRLDLINK